MIGTLYSLVTVSTHLPQNIKKIQTQGNAPERYRLQLSDSIHFQPCEFPCY